MKRVHRLAALNDGLGTLQPSEQIDLANLLRTLLIALGGTPAFRPAIAVQRGQS